MVPSNRISLLSFLGWFSTSMLAGERVILISNQVNHPKLDSNHQTALVFLKQKHVVNESCNTNPEPMTSTLVCVRGQSLRRRRRGKFSSQCKSRQVTWCGYPNTSSSGMCWWWFLSCLTISDHQRLQTFPRAIQPSASTFSFLSTEQAETNLCSNQEQSGTSRSETRQAFSQLVYFYRFVRFVKHATSLWVSHRIAVKES